MRSHSSFHYQETVSGKGLLILFIALLFAGAALAGALIGYFTAQGIVLPLLIAVALISAIPLLSYMIYKKMILPYHRRLEDANLELRLRHEELLDTRDDLFIKFLGIYDVNYAANSPRLFSDRMKDVADITARVMEAGICLIYIYDKKRDDLVLTATNGKIKDAVGNARISLGEGIEGWVARRLEPAMLRDFKSDARYRETPGLALSTYASLYCLPLYVYSNGALMGVIEAVYEKQRKFTDEDINFFTALAGIISNTIQNEQMQAELRKMNMELEQWVAEKTEELRASEERYRTLVENACESIFVLAENGDVMLANEQAARLTGFRKFDLLHKNLSEFVSGPGLPEGMLSEAGQGRLSLRHGELKRADGSTVPVDITAVSLTLMGKRFVQSVIHDVSDRTRLQELLEQKEREITELRSKRP